MHQPRLTSSHIAARVDRAWEQRAHNTRADRGTVSPSLHKRTKRTRCWRVWASTPLTSLHATPLGATARVQDAAAHKMRPRAWNGCGIAGTMCAGTTAGTTRSPSMGATAGPPPQSVLEGPCHAGYVYHEACKHTSLCGAWYGEACMQAGHDVEGTPKKANVYKVILFV